MSGVFKSVGKVFKKVAKVVKKVAPIIIAAAAIYFTAGMALGAAVPGFGTGSAVTGWLGSVGGTGTFLNGVIAGAVKGAAYGAVIGGATAAVTGGSISKGILMGGVGGAVTGGVMGGINFTPPGTVVPGASAGAPVSLHPGAAAPSVTGAVPLTTGIPSPASIVPSAPSTISKFLNSDLGSQMAGGLVKGLGSGAGDYFGSVAEADALEKAAQLDAKSKIDAANRTAANYSGASGLMTNATLTGGSADDQFASTAPSATQTYTQTMWRFDPEQGRIVKIA